MRSAYRVILWKGSMLKTWTQVGGYYEKLMLKEKGMRIWAGLIWLGIGCNVGLL
jgi:hypothetical protein